MLIKKYGMQKQKLFLRAASKICYQGSYLNMFVYNSFLLWKEDLLDKLTEQ